MLLCQEPQPEILGNIGVLILIHQDSPKAGLIVFEDVLVAAQDGQAMQQKITEIAGIKGEQALLVGLVELQRAAIGELTNLARGHGIGCIASVLPALDDPKQQAWCPAFFIKIGGLHDLF